VGEKWFPKKPRKATAPSRGPPSEWPRKLTKAEKKGRKKRIKSLALLGGGMGTKSSKKSPPGTKAESRHFLNPKELSTTNQLEKRRGRPRTDGRLEGANEDMVRT